MKISTSILQIDNTHICSLRTLPITNAFINSLPPRIEDLHGSSVELFFENGIGCSIDGVRIPNGPRDTICSLCFEDTRKLEIWRQELTNESLKPVIITTDLRELWVSQGLTALLGGPREVVFYKRLVDGCRLLVEDPHKFDAIHLYRPDDYSQNIVIYASDEFPGDVFMTSGMCAPQLVDMIKCEVDGGVEFGPVSQVRRWGSGKQKSSKIVL